MDLVVARAVVTLEGEEFLVADFAGVVGQGEANVDAQED